jgi:hypothetical protein
MPTVDEEFLAAAMKFIDIQAKASKPFLLWFNSTRMHVFTHLKPESMGKTGKESTPGAATRTSCPGTRRRPADHRSGRRPRDRHRQCRSGSRPIDGREATPVPGAEGPSSPFFSLDSKWLGFWTGIELRKIALEEGAPISLCRAQRPLGVSGGEAGRILQGQGHAPIFEVPPAAPPNHPPPLTHEPDLSCRFRVWHRWLDRGSAAPFQYGRRGELHFASR